MGVDTGAELTKIRVWKKGGCVGEKMHICPGACSV